MKTSKEIASENEFKFQDALKHFIYLNRDINKAKVYWDQMFFCVQFAVSNIAKSKLKGVLAPDLDGKILNATIKIMENIRDGVNPKKLSSYCYFPVIENLFNNKLVFNEQAISLEAWQEWQYKNESEC